MAAQGASRVLAAAFLNLTAVARAVAQTDELAILCAGREDRFALDDALCAGLLLERVAAQLGAPVEVDDAGRAATELARCIPVDAALLQGVAAGRALVAIGLGEDVEHCARLDAHDIVPEMQDRMIRLENAP